MTITTKWKIDHKGFLTTLERAHLQEKRSFYDRAEELDAFLPVTKCNLLQCARARTRNNDERVAQGNDRRIPSQDVSRFRNSFAGRNKFLKDPTSARSATAGRKIPAVTLRDLDVVEDPRLHILEIRSRRKACGLNY